MKDVSERDKGKYEETYTITIDEVIYTITEVTVVGRNFEILSFTREYNPPLKYSGST